MLLRLDTVSGASIADNLRCADGDFAVRLFKTRFGGIHGNQPYRKKISNKRMRSCLRAVIALCPCSLICLENDTHSSMHALLYLFSSIGRLVISRFPSVAFIVYNCDFGLYSSLKKCP